MIHLQELLAESYVQQADEQPENITKSSKVLETLIAKLIKQFGNNKATMIEVFIRPYLLLANVQMCLGDLHACQQSYVVLSSIIHELYGNESELELQLHQISVQLQMITLGQMIEEIAYCSKHN
jgi:hypothetical protein